MRMSNETNYKEVGLGSRVPTRSQAILAICDAVIETEQASPMGAPGGHIYAAQMTIGLGIAFGAGIGWTAGCWLTSRILQLLK